MHELRCCYVIDVADINHHILGRVWFVNHMRIPYLLQLRIFSSHMAV